MSNTHSVCFVSRVTINSVIYYYCSHQRVSPLTLTDATYSPYILSVGNSSKIGNFGEGSQVGKCSLVLLLGQEQYQGSYNIDITNPWNNGTCEIRICDLDNDSDWSDCDYYYKGVIKNFTINNDNVSFDIEDSNQKDNTTLPRYTAEDIIDGISYLSQGDIPKGSVGKRIPMQYGDLTDKSNGIFAKGLSISSKVGFQEIHFDTEELNQFTLSSSSGIGVWEDGLKRFFIGKSDSEYGVESTKNIIKFTVDTTTTLNSGFSMGATEGQEQIEITDGSLITFDRESADNYYTETAELLGSNIIAIDNELMMLLDVPDTSSSPNTVWVERGYNNSTIESHDALSPIYQSAKYSARNLLSFTELFLAKVVANPYYNIVLELGTILDNEPDEYINSPLNRIVDNSSSTYFTYLQRITAGCKTQYNFDIRFEKIEGDYTLTGMYAGVKLVHRIYSTGYTTTIDNALFEMSLFDPYQDINYDEETDIRTTVGNAAYVFQSINYSVNPDQVISIDTITNISRDVIEGNYYLLVPDLITGGYGYRLNLTNLNNLNRKWKVNLNCYTNQFDEDQNMSSEYRFSLYQFGMWADFFVDFTKRRIVGTLQGRKVTSVIDTILDTLDVGEQIRLPIQCIAHILTTELGYVASDFDTDNWSATYDYVATLIPDQLISLSYGLDEHEKGWDLCQKIASQFCMMLVKSDSGKIKIYSLLQFQDTGYYGYSKFTYYAISIDDIVISGGVRQFTIQHTGTDRLRNSVRINYRRNNSTDEYQKIYPEVQSSLDSYVLIESGITLSQARTTYFNGEKTETLEIDAYAISQEDDAERLAKWHLNDKAEVRFYVSCTLPYYHYTDKNSKSEQYNIGDIVYFDGIYRGVTFNSNRLFVVQEIEKDNQGRTLTLHSKSIQPVSMF